MKMLIDANLVISFLLKGKDSSDPIRLLFELTLSSRFELVIPEDVLDEVRAKALSKPFLRDRIDPTEPALSRISAPAFSSAANRAASASDATSDSE